MLYLIQSNKMECLADSLINCLQDSAGQGESVFEADQVLVQSPGMSQWLKIQIAEKLGIAANIDFPLPSSFIWQLYQAHVEDLPEQSAFTKPNMAWKLMAILPSQFEDAKFASIKQYLKDAPPLKLYQLASKIADVYDQYLVYRPDWINHWEAGFNTLPDTDDQRICEAHPWQPVLWRALVSYSKHLGESQFHRANLHDTLLEKLYSQEQTSTKPLMVFGISAMPLQQLEVLKALSSTRDVLIFWFNPSQHYWGDIVDKKTQEKAKLTELAHASKSDVQQIGAEFLDIGNPLLASWGKLGRDYQDMLLGFELQQEDCFIETQPKTLLEHIQTDINNLAFRASTQELDAQELLSNGIQCPKVEIALNDNSLQVHGCHSKVRELEVLHDQLLKRFKDNPSWHPGDVIVMMPDVASYAPFIEGVFGSVESELAIPFAISDRNVGQVSPLIASFLQLMKLHQSRITLSDVLSLLEVPAIQRKFTIELQEFELLQHWLTDAGVRWGWDKQDKARWDLPAEQQNTWVFGLQRLLAGYAISSGELYQGTQEDISAYADIEGQQAVALGKCYQFTGLLLKVLAFCQEQQSLQSKVEQGLTLLEDMYQADESEQTDLQILRETLENLTAHTAQFPEDIDQDIFVSELQQNIQEKGVGQRFLAGYVNFCTLMPMRSIPFKMVCLLGINDTDYPRQSVPMGFDLMRLAPVKRGDRSRRLDDRYLFLEALLSAREQLYFSYQGFSQKDNSPLAPSILLSELLEYCQHGFSLSGQLSLEAEETEKNLLAHLSYHHKLQPFDKAYFDTQANEYGHPKTFSFNINQQRIAQQTNQPLTPYAFNTLTANSTDEAIVANQSDWDANQVTLDELIQFYENPAKAFIMHRWQSRFYSLGQVSSDEEPFGFDGLDKYILIDRLVQHQLSQFVNQSNQNSKAPIIAQFRAEGRLPTAYTGDLALRPLMTQSSDLAKQIVELSQSNADLLEDSSMYQEQNIDIALTLNDTLLTGRIHHLYGPNLLLWRSGKLRSKDRIALYLQWLALCAQGGKVILDKGYFLNVGKAYSLPAIEPQQAAEQLSVWIKYWQLGHTQILHFYPEAAWQWVKTQDVGKTIKAFEGDNFSKGDADDAHIQRVCPDLNIHFDAFTELSEELLMPLLEQGGDK
ncbi:exodeoxyribonuclease V subunit gamma [Paraglaciecola marina]|uniref:exodeoxyribonuclease V subunit gamma n=1 Tax=Paraglaciecola marina TaxID=2500157 RepID=UPI0010604D7E|nr:exodeoxyribonuclease V subunit gamma [Paraglaciecola marina]